MMREHVTVGIVGGGIAGLTLAKMLEMLGVSYILYESYHHVAPKAGASLGLMPNGLRIFDQLGLINQIETFSVDHDRWEHRDGNSGQLHKLTTAMRHFPAIFGYGGFFMARQDVLQLLFDSLEDKTRVYTSKRVTSIQDLGDSALVEASDGSSFTCDFVAGADGVRSIVREFIHAKTAKPSADYLRANTLCVFGMSKPLDQIGPGCHFVLYRREVSALVFSGLHGKLYWFFFQKLDEPLEFGTRKEFTPADIDAVYSQIADATVTEGIRISDVYNSREVAVMTALEEGVGEEWFSGRIFLLGDSVHKMVPHAAMGANQAMESAACFVNNLRKLQLDCSNNQASRITASEAYECLDAYANKRRDRMQAIVQSASATCKNQLMIGPTSEAFIRALPQLQDETILLKSIESLSQAEKLENWKCGSNRVDYYTEQSRTVLELLSKKMSLDDLGLGTADSGSRAS